MKSDLKARLGRLEKVAGKDVRHFLVVGQDEKEIAAQRAKIKPRPGDRVIEILSAIPRPGPYPARDDAAWRLEAEVESLEGELAALKREKA